MPRTIAFALLAALPGIGAANDFPTQARVEFVLGCMQQRGGQSYDTLYPCVCLIDHIAESMTYAQFTEAQVFAQLRSTPGERGGVFRDPEQAQSLAESLEAAIERGEAQCFVRSRQSEAAYKGPLCQQRNRRDRLKRGR